MTSDDHDEALTDRLRAALAAADPVPPTILAAANAAFTWRTIDAELAELVSDSALAHEVGVRSTGTTRRITFRAGGIEVDILIADEREMRLMGQLVPSGAARVELQTPHQVRETTTDDLGRFSFADLPAGSVRLLVERPGRTSVATDWILV